MSESNKILQPDMLFAATPDTDILNAEHGEKPSAALHTPDEALNKLLRTMTDNRPDAISQLSGFLITEDPAYLPDVEDVRALARRIGRDKLLEVLIRSYLDTHGIES